MLESTFLELTPHELNLIVKLGRLAFLELTPCELDLIVRKLGRKEGARKFLGGEREVIVSKVKYVIDLDADPYCPYGLEVESHKKQGRLEWNPQSVTLCLSDKQKDDNSIKGYNLKEELENQSVANANLLNHLLVYPSLIPESWKKEIVFFWGTIYHRPDGSLYVSYMFWNGYWWDRSYCCLDNNWNAEGPAALLSDFPTITTEIV